MLLAARKKQAAAEICAMPWIELSRVVGRWMDAGAARHAMWRCAHATPFTSERWTPTFEQQQQAQADEAKSGVPLRRKSAETHRRWQGHHSLASEESAAQVASEWRLPYVAG